LDLLEIVPEVTPPVCKLANYGKYKYEVHRKEKDAKKKQKTILLKEIKIRPKIDEHDLQTKIKHVIRFLSDGNKAKLTIMFRGREMAHIDIGRKILDRIIDMLKEISIVEQTPKLEGRNMTLVLSPRRENAKT
jgi:translation initiation factor IF-3